MYPKALVSGLVLGALLASSPVSAQNQASPHVSAGAFWSANFATVALSPAAEGVKARQWIGGGLTVDVPLAGGLSLDGRAFWNRRGARLPVPGTAGYQDVSADYVSVPVLLKVSARGPVRPYFLGGVELGVRTRARVRTVVGTVDVEEDAGSLIRRTDLALDAGAGLERTIGSRSLFVEALYAHGLTNVTPDGTSDTTKTRTLTLLAGVRF